MTMDAVKIDTLSTNKTLLSSKVPDTSEISKEKDPNILFVDEIDEDDEIRLRLSDDEDVEQDNTSRHSQSQETNLDNKVNDLEFDVYVAVASKNAAEHHYKGLINNQKIESTQEDRIRLPEEEEEEEEEEEDSSGNSSLDEISVNETTDDINDAVSMMSGNERVPPLMHNSPKYWSNNFDNRWKGSNNQSRSRHSFSNRNSNDWYSKQQLDKDKFNNRNSFGNNHNNHFNRVRHSTGGSYKGHARDNYNKESRHGDSNESSKIKNKISSSNDTNRSVHENGVSNDLQTKENGSHVRKEISTNGNIKQNEKESEIKSDLKNSQQKFEKSKTIAEGSGEKNSGKNGSHNLGKNVDENCETKESSDTKTNSDGILSSTKDCDALTTEVKKITNDVHLQKMNNKEEKKCGSNETEKDLKDTDEHVTDESRSVDSDHSDKISHNNTGILRKDGLENLMEVDDSSKNVCNDKNDNSNTSDESQDITIKINKNTDTSVSENLENETKVINDSLKQKGKSTNEFSDKILNDIAKLNTQENQSLVDTAMDSKMEISESDHKDDSVQNNDKITEIMDVDNVAASSNSSSLTVTENKISEPNASQTASNKEKRNILEKSQLVSEENNSTSGETDKSMTIDKQSEKDKEAKGRDISSSPGIIDEQEKLSAEEVDLADDDSEKATVYPKQGGTDTGNDSSQTSVNAMQSSPVINKDTSLTVPIPTVDKDKVDESNESGRAVVHKRRRRKRMSGVTFQDVSLNDAAADNGVRQKRRSARNAEEMIRKEIMKNNEEDDDSDEKSGRVVTVHYKSKPNSTSLQLQPQSPPSLKRTFEDSDNITESLTLKKIRSSSEVVVTPIIKLPDKEKKELAVKSKESIAQTRDLVRKISQEDIRGKLQKMTPEDMEALLVQKIVECITIRGEMGKLREQARASKRNQEATRLKCQQLQKQVEGFEMVLKRFTFDKNSNGEKYLPPIKINRSVGLQVNFLSQEHGIQNLKQLGALKVAPGNNASNVGIANPSVTTSVVNKPGVSIVQDNRPQNQNPRKIMKTRSPRRPDMGNVMQASPVAATPATPTALVMNKPVAVDPKRTITLQNAANIVQLLPPGHQQTVVVNSAVSGSSSGTANNRQTTLTIQRTTTPTITKASDLIDLTDEEDKTKASVVTPITSINSRLPRVLHTVPGSVALTNATNLRLVQTSAHIPQTAIVGNNAPRVAYVMQGGVNGGTRQLVLTSPNQIRPVTSVSTRNISTISYKPGVPTLTNGTVRVLTTQAPTAVQVARHPAPLPETPSPESNPLWKLTPPAPVLKISKVATGIVLSWNMPLTDKYAEIVSYQLYAYQEVAGTSPNAALWKKVGDVRALPLPMACTLTQFTEGNNYYFAVRAVDVHSRFGQYSKPGNISL